MRVFICNTNKMTLKLIRSILNLIPNYSDFDFFMSSNTLGFIVLDDDQGNHLPKFKVQIKNKFFGFIFKELNKNEPRKLEEIKISHDEFKITSTNFLGYYDYALNNFNVNLNYKGDLLTGQLYELCKYYLYITQ